MDLVTVLDDYCASLGFGFSYGNKANNNLLNDLEDGKTYLILDPIRETDSVSIYGGDGEVTFAGSFMLLIKSNLDNVYYTQNGVSKENGKYVKNILPLKQNLKALKKLIQCSDFTIRNWSKVDATDVLDENMDGVVVTFSISYL